MGKRCIIITAYSESGVSPNVQVTPDDLVICADGGWKYAEEEGIIPNVIIGDFDSSEYPSARTGHTGDTEHTVSEGTDFEIAAPEIIRLNTKKDLTDTMECVKYGIAKGFDDFIIVGGLSGRFDHTIANVQTLSFLTDMECKAVIIDGKNRALMLDGGSAKLNNMILEAEIGALEGLGLDFEELDTAVGRSISIENMPGFRFSVYSYTERCTGVSIRGAEYPLTDAVLTQSYPIGTSNEFIKDTNPEISVLSGRLLIIISKD